MKKIIFRIIYFVIGLGALAWFLIRVIPKPSRATYPCQRAAFPIASGFIIYVAALLSSAFALNKLRNQWKLKKNFAASLSLIVLIFSSFFILQSDRPFVYGEYKNNLEDPNQPMGIGKGIFPGRVVWVHDSTAVNHECTNVIGDYWWQEDNVDQAVVNKMVSDALQTLTGKTTDAEAWDALFRYFNIKNGKGDTGYTSGEKIVIKINLNNGTRGDQYIRSDNPLDTSPQVVYAVLDQLVNAAGVAQSDIGFGDPGRNVDDIFWDNFYHTFPLVKYWGDGNGRTPIIQSTNPVLFNSDGSMENYLPQCYLEADYMINIPVLKQHHRAGISLTSKNHFGTFVPFMGSAFPLHYSLPCTEGDGTVNNGEYGEYRIFVDFIGHKDLGGKTILHLVDGLWSSTDWGDPPYKWNMAPFNGQYPASIFASQDPVAIESVGFDFLYTEFYNGNPSGKAFPQYSGVDDFLHQAADSINWAEGILYDPEGDGSYLPRSMGVHEHWNNAAEKKYARNLGLDEGIELLYLGDSISVNVEFSAENPYGFILANNYPNPFNPVTTIMYRIKSPTKVNLKVYNSTGKEVRTLINDHKNTGIYKIEWNGKNNKGEILPSGVYFYRIVAGDLSETKKMILMK